MTQNQEHQSLYRSGHRYHLAPWFPDNAPSFDLGIARKWSCLFLADAVHKTDKVPLPYFSSSAGSGSSKIFLSKFHRVFGLERGDVFRTWGIAQLLSALVFYADSFFANSPGFFRGIECNGYAQRLGVFFCNLDKVLGLRNLCISFSNSLRINSYV